MRVEGLNNGNLVFLGEKRERVEEKFFGIFFGDFFGVWNLCGGFSMKKLCVMMRKIPWYL